MPAVQSILVYRAEDIELNFSMVPARDITGWTLSLTVAKAYNAQNKLFQLTGIITSGPNGTFQFIIPSVTLDTTPDKYVYDVFRTNPGFNRILAIGEFELKPDAREP